MVMTISTYTEPVPVPAVSELPQAQEEDDDREEYSEFAEILAGMMRNNESGQKPGLSAAELSDAEIDAFAELGNVGLLAGIEAAEETEGEFDVAFSDSALLEGYRDILLSAEHLFTRSGEISSGAETNDILAGFSDLITKDDLKDVKPKSDHFSLLKEAAQARDEAQLLARRLAAEAGEESLSAQAQNKRARNINEHTASSSKNEKQDELSAKEKAGEKNIYLQNKPEDTKSRLDEFRSRSRRDKVTFEVRDMRTETNSNNGTRSYTAVETSAGRVNGAVSVQEMTLELRMPNFNNSGQSMAQTSWESGSGSALENLLARELHQNFNGDIVRHASMALRDGGEGTIKIALKPESLGNVKIHLEMTDNKITGRIVVESAEALNAFRKEISALEQAFRDSGFANANLDLSLTSGGSGAEWQERENGSYSPRMASSRYDDSFEHDAMPIDVFFDRKSGLINMFA